MKFDPGVVAALQPRAEVSQRLRRLSLDEQIKRCDRSNDTQISNKTKDQTIRTVHDTHGPRYARPNDTQDQTITRQTIHGATM